MDVGQWSWEKRKKIRQENLICISGAYENGFSFFEFPILLPDVAFDPEYAEKFAKKMQIEDFPIEQDGIFSLFFRSYVIFGQSSFFTFGAKFPLAGYWYEDCGRTPDELRDQVMDFDRETGKWSPVKRTEKTKEVERRFGLPDGALGTPGLTPEEVIICDGPSLSDIPSWTKLMDHLRNVAMGAVAAQDEGEGEAVAVENRATDMPDPLFRLRASDVYHWTPFPPPLLTPEMIQTVLPQGPKSIASSCTPGLTTIEHANHAAQQADALRGALGKVSQVAAEALGVCGCEADEFAYPWHEAPEWAQRAATDANGRAYWYAEMPRRERNMWMRVVASECLLIGEDDFERAECHNWHNSLRARPAETLTAAEHLDDVTTERDQLAAEVDRLAKQVEEYRQWCEALAVSRTKCLDETERGRDAAREECANWRRTAEAEQRRAAEVQVTHAALSKEIDRLKGELAKLRNAAAEVVWACPEAIGRRRIAVRGERIWLGNTSVCMTVEQGRVMFPDWTDPPQDGTYEIRAPGRAVLVRKES